MNTETQYLGKPCKHGHLTACGKYSLRTKLNRHCVKCKSIYAAQRRTLNLARAADIKTLRYMGEPCVNGHVLPTGLTERNTKSGACVICERAHGYAMRKAQPLRHRFRTKRCIAKKNGIEFNLDFADVVWPEHCPVLGTKLDYSICNKGGAMTKASPSFDRIDPSKGYIKGNVIIVSMKANAIKQDASADEIIKVGQFYKSLLDKPLSPRACTSKD